MSHGSQQAAFAEFVVEARPLLLGAAYLMFGAERRAEDVVHCSLAQLYRAGPAGRPGLLTALRVVLFSEPGQLPPAGTGGERFELVDGIRGQDHRPAAIVGDLSRLPEGQRRVLILERFVELPSTQIAAVTGTTVVRVHDLARDARAALLARDPARASDQHLAEQLRTAVPPELGEPSDPTADVAYGRALVRRRALRTSGVVLVVLVAAVLGGVRLAPVLAPVLGSDRQSAQSSAPAPAPSAPSPSVACDSLHPGCPALAVRDWRARTARVASSYLDPQRSYFSGYTYAYDDRYDSEDFWRGGGGVLGFDMFRLNEGATEVYVQIATSSAFAPRCGAETGRTCQSMRLTNGHRFTLTDTDDVSEGVEVQYSPDGDQVITVVAHNISKGKVLRITRPQLVALVQDPRLRLPQP